MEEDKKKFVKLLDFYDRLDPKEKVKFETLLDEKIDGFKERDVNND